MSTAIQVSYPSSLEAYEPRDYLSISAQRTAISNLMAGAMQKDIDYGTIPGTPKPTLYKPGSEKLLAMFHLAAQPVVEDLSTPDVMRYRVFVRITESASGRYLGEGVGEASSGESKYKWRAAVCEEEWQTTPADRRRVFWKKGNPPYPAKQVRTEMEDIANTVLKMAKKRAQIDAVLTVTAASDVFMQDAQEIVDAGLDAVDDANPRPTAHPRPITLQPRQQPAQQQNVPAQQPRPTAQTQQTAAPASNAGPAISEPQARRFWAIASGSGFSKDQINEYLEGTIGVSRHTEIPKSRYEEAISWAEGN